MSPLFLKIQKTCEPYMHDWKLMQALHAWLEAYASSTYMAGSSCKLYMHDWKVMQALHA